MVHTQCSTCYSIVWPESYSWLLYTALSKFCWPSQCYYPWHEPLSWSQLANVQHFWQYYICFTGTSLKAMSQDCVNTSGWSCGLILSHAFEDSSAQTTLTASLHQYELETVAHCCSINNNIIPQRGLQSPHQIHCFTSFICDRRNPWTISDFHILSTYPAILQYEVSKNDTLPNTSG